MVEGCQAGGLAHLFQYMRKYIAENPKQGSKSFNSIEKTIDFDHLVIIYLWLYCTDLSSKLFSVEKKAGFELWADVLSILNLGVIKNLHVLLIKTNNIVILKRFDLRSFRMEMKAFV